MKRLDFFSFSYTVDEGNINDVNINHTERMIIIPECADSEYFLWKSVVVVAARFFDVEIGDIVNSITKDIFVSISMNKNVLSYIYSRSDITIPIHVVLPDIGKVEQVSWETKLIKPTDKRLAVLEAIMPFGGLTEKQWAVAVDEVLSSNRWILEGMVDDD